ncbi:uncharacterized protein LOC135074711 [Ostrinia nubilalis]|uniref:uncharacterized protein LOC135074711 n=1 Tax=Ostrinia nubilalis TaxID=29057 RepID=UPI003082313B
MQFATTLHKFAVLKEHANQFLNGEVVGSWFNPWQIENNYTNPYKVVRIASAARQFMTELAALQSDLALGISTITGKRSSEEWMKTYVSPIMIRISDLVKEAEARSNSEPSVSPSNNLYLWNNNVQ